MNGERDLESKVSTEMSIVLIGDIKVGKSALVEKYSRGFFRKDYLGTIGVDYENRITDIDGQIVKVHLWDTSGQQAFLWEATKHIKAADGFVFVYDVTDVQSFRSVATWLKLINRCNTKDRLPKLLLGNKYDQRHKRVVSSSQAKEFAIPEGMMHIEASSSSGQNVNAAFYILAREILRWRHLGCVNVIGSAEFPIEATEGDSDDIGGIQFLADTSEYTHLFKILLLGGSRVGKTSLRFRFSRNYYSSEYKATSGFDYSTRNVLIDGDRVKVQVWDVSGDEVYDQTRKAYYKGANAFVIVYDVTNKESFREAEYLLKELNMYGNSDSPKILVGNKIDRTEKRCVDYFDGKEFADGWRIPFVEGSARNGSNVDVAFMKLTSALKRKMAPWKKVHDFA